MNEVDLEWDGEMGETRRSNEAVPDGIAREHILAAMVEFDNSGLPTGYSTSTRYLVAHDGRHYPPPAIMALAIRRLSGSLPPGVSGGEKTKCFQVFRECGFEILNKRKPSPPDS